jgi:hypothetical protein
VLIAMPLLLAATAVVPIVLVGGSGSSAAGEDDGAEEDAVGVEQFVGADRLPMPSVGAADRLPMPSAWRSAGLGALAVTGVAGVAVVMSRARPSPMIAWTVVVAAVLLLSAIPAQKIGEAQAGADA